MTMVRLLLLLLLMMMMMMMNMYADDNATVFSLTATAAVYIARILIKTRR